METAAATAAGFGHADSVESSPRSRGGDSWDDPPFPSAAGVGGRIRLMCSYGGRIVPRPTEKSLCYLGGETRMVVVDRHSSLANVSAKLSRTLGGRSFSIKYQLPNEDLDSLISVATDEDLENMVEEYDRIVSAAATGGSGCSTGSSRLRLFLFPSKQEMSPASSIGSLLDDSKSETWFVDALNSAMGGMGIDGLPRGLSSDSASVNCLLGLQDDSSVHSRSGAAITGGIVSTHSERPEQLVLLRPDSSNRQIRHGQDVHSVPDSPMLETSSSFGSASSAPSLSNLPPIRVRLDERPSVSLIAGLEDHLGTNANMSAATVAGGQRLEDDCKEATYAPQLHPPPSVPLSASTLTIAPTENPSRAFSSDDDKSDHGGLRNPPQQHSKPNQIESSVPDPTSRMLYLNATADPNRELPVSSDPSYRVAAPATSATGYQLQPVQAGQFQQQQLHAQIHQQPLQQQLLQQQHYIQANPHYMRHPATGGVMPVSSYFPVSAHTIQQSPQSHPYDPQIPMYYYPVRPNPPYNLTTLQPGLGDPNSMSSAAKPTVPVPCVPVKPDLPGNLYRTPAVPLPAASQPQLIRMTADQAHPYSGMGYHVVQPHHPSQSPAAMVNYGYEFAADHTRPKMYYSQAIPPPALAPQCQPVSSGVIIAGSFPPTDAKVTRAT